MTHPFEHVTAKQALALVATNTFRPFTASDWMGFAGCNSKDPMICDEAEGAPGVVILVDDTVICLIDEDANWAQFDLSDGSKVLI